MLKAILIDDEKKIVALMERLVDWEEIGIEIIGTANSGKQGMEIIIDKEPDIVVTDIRMPGLDGLEMIRQLRDMGKNISFILVSGHKHFEYAHSAIKYGVENYLLKPINRQELRENLISIRDKILNERNVITEQVSMKRRMELVSGKMKKQFISQIAQKERIVGSMPENLNREYMLSLKPGNYQIVIVKADLKKHLDKEQITIMNHKINSLLENEFQKLCYEYVETVYQGFLVLFLNYGEVELKDIFERALEEGLFRFDEYCDITIGLSSVYDENVKDFNILYQEAWKSIRSRIFLGINRIIEYSQIPDGQEKVLDGQENDKLKKFIELRNREKIEAWLQQFLYGVRKKRPDINLLFSELNWIYETIRAEIFEQTVDFHFPVGQNEFQENMDNARNTTELAEALKQFIWCVLDEYEAGLEGAEKRIIRTAKDYIAEHYAENISLERISKLIYMNPVYFSTVFKKEEGINFSDYLTSYRVEMAKKFLKDEKYSIHEISDMVGYGNARYFSRVFQKEVGIKPSDYRKLYV